MATGLTATTQAISNNKAVASHVYQKFNYLGYGEQFLPPANHWRESHFMLNILKGEANILFQLNEQFISETLNSLTFITRAFWCRSGSSNRFAHYNSHLREHNG